MLQKMKLLIESHKNADDAIHHAKLMAKVEDPKAWEEAAFQIKLLGSDYSRMSSAVIRLAAWSVMAQEDAPLAPCWNGKK